MEIHGGGIMVPLDCVYVGRRPTVQPSTPWERGDDWRFVSIE
jgi:hypothetical protein